MDANRDGSLSAELVVRRLIDEGFSQGHLDVCDELIADEIVEHQDRVGVLFQLGAISRPPGLAKRP